MRFVYLLCVLMTYGHFVQGQTSLYKNGLTYKFLITDYNTLDPLYQAGNSQIKVLDADIINFAGEIGYFRHINKSLNIGLPLRLGSMDSHHIYYPDPDSSCQPCEPYQLRVTNELFFGADVVAVYKFNNDYLLKETFFLAPYIFAGIGGVYMSQRTGNFDFQIPMGLGLNVKLRDLLYLQFQLEYRKSLIINKDNLAISVGIAWLLNFKSKTKE